MGANEHKKLVTDIHTALENYGFYVDKGDKVRTNLSSYENEITSSFPDLYIKKNVDSRSLTDFIVECKTIDSDKKTHSIDSRVETQLKQFSTIRPTYLAFYEKDFKPFEKTTSDTIKKLGVGVILHRDNGRLCFKKYATAIIDFGTWIGKEKKLITHNPYEIFESTNLIPNSMPRKERLILPGVLNFCAFEDRTGETKLHDINILDFMKDISKSIPGGLNTKITYRIDSFDDKTFWALMRAIKVKFQKKYPYSSIAWAAELIDPTRGITGFSIASLRRATELIMEAKTQLSDGNSFFLCNHHSAYLLVAFFDRANNVLFYLRIRMHQNLKINPLFEIERINCISNGTIINRPFNWDKVHDIPIGHKTIKIPKRIPLNKPMVFLIQDLSYLNEDYIIYAWSEKENLFLETPLPETVIAALNKKPVTAQLGTVSVAEFEDLSLITTVKINSDDG